jgi:hypothetical protein
MRVYYTTNNGRAALPGTGAEPPQMPAPLDIAGPLAYTWPLP